MAEKITIHHKASSLLKIERTILLPADVIHSLFNFRVWVQYFYFEVVTQALDIHPCQRFSAGHLGHHLLESHCVIHYPVY